jgi:hypothetical protein
MAFAPPVNHADNRAKLGKWIARHQGRIVDGLKFERESGTTSAERWIAKSGKSGKSGLHSPTAQSVKEKIATDDDSFDPVDEFVEVDL